MVNKVAIGDTVIVSFDIIITVPLPIEFVDSNYYYNLVVHLASFKPFIVKIAAIFTSKG